MPRRLINKFATDNFTAKIHYDAEWSEYIVTVFEDIDDRLRKVCQYCTDDRVDAVDTAKYELNRRQKAYGVDDTFAAWQARIRDAATLWDLLQCERDLARDYKWYKSLPFGHWLTLDTQIQRRLDNL